MTSHFLVQWMPGPCTEAGPSREFSLIMLDDIKDDYRYALETGRITMATYRFSAGTNTGSMHRLCKILGSGEKTSLESEMLSTMGGSSGQPRGQRTTQGSDQGSGADEITCILKVEEIDADDTQTTEMNVDQSSQPANSSKYPPWEVQQEMIALLDENHQILRENELLRKKLAKAVDVMDLQNILETTIVNIQHKRLTQLTSDVGQVPGSSGLQLETANTAVADEIIDITSLSSAMEQDPTPVPISPVTIQTVPVVSSGNNRPTTSRQTPPTSITYQNQPRHSQTGRQQPRPSPTFQQQARPAPTQHHPGPAAVQQQQRRPSPVQKQQSRPAPIQQQPIRHTEQQHVRRPSQQQHQTQPQQQPQIQQQQQHQSRQPPMQHHQQQQTRPAPIQQLQQHNVRTLSENTQQQQQSQQMTILEPDNPYIVNVQSLAEPSTQPGPQVLPSRTDQPGPSGTGGMGAYPRTSQGPNVSSQRIGTKRQQRGGKFRQIRAPQWQSSYVTEGILHLQRDRSGPETNPTDVTEIPTTSSQQQTATQQMAEQRVMTSGDYDDDNLDKLVELVPGMGVKLSRRQLRMAQKTKGFSQYTRNLMMLVFSMKELSVCSVTGYKATGRGSENAVARPALDQTRVHAIIAAVQRRFPSVSIFKVKQIMSQKIMSLRKTFRAKQFRSSIARKQGRMHHLKIKDLIS